PAPRPFVRWSPIWMRSSARLVARTCASVLAATNSTPLRPVSIMRLTALLPPPPRPMTRMTAFSLLLIAMRSRSPDPATLEEVLYDVPDPLEPTTTSTQVALPLLTPRHGGGVAAVLLHAEPDQPYRRGVGGTSHHVRQAGYAVGLTYPHGETEAFVRDLVDARHERGPASDDDVAGQQLERAHLLLDVSLHQVEDLDDAGLDHLGQLEGRDARRVVGVRDFQLDVAVRQLRQRDAVAALDALGLVGLDAQELADVLGDVVAADRDHGRV